MVETAVPTSQDPPQGHVLTRRGERRVFLFITVVLFPVLSVIVVGGLGLAIWIWQMLFGLPGPG